MKRLRCTARSNTNDELLKFTQPNAESDGGASDSSRDATQANPPEQTTNAALESESAFESLLAQYLLYRF